MENKNRIVLNFNAAVALLAQAQKALVTDLNVDFDTDFDE